jgi:hypothetical protein
LRYFDSSAHPAAQLCAGTGRAGCLTNHDPGKPEKHRKPLRKTAVTEALQW